MNKGKLEMCRLSRGIATDDYSKKFEAGACKSARGDKTDPKCSVGDRTIHGSHRPKVLSLHSRLRTSY
jgi:hypothetical protein